MKWTDCKWEDYKTWEISLSSCCNRIGIVDNLNKLCKLRNIKHGMLIIFTYRRTPDQINREKCRDWNDWDLMIISSIIGDDVQSLPFSICRGSIEAQIIDNYTCFFYGIPSLSAISKHKDWWQWKFSKQYCIRREKYNCYLILMRWEVLLNIITAILWF